MRSANWIMRAPRSSSWTNQEAGSAEKFFALATEYLRASQEEKAVDLLAVTKKEYAGGATRIRIRNGS